MKSCAVLEEVFDSDEFHINYCGNCGAKMDGTDINDGATKGVM